MDQTELNRIISTVDDVANRGLGDTAFHIKLILRHIALLKEFI